MSNTKNKIYELRTARIEFLPQHFVMINIKDECEIQLADAIANTEAFYENYDGVHKFFVLIDTGKYSTITKEARDYGSRKDANEMSKAIAVVVYSLAQRLIINIHARFISRHKTKMRAFTNAIDARSWLELQHKKHYSKQELLSRN